MTTREKVRIDHLPPKRRRKSLGKETIERPRRGSRIPSVKARSYGRIVDTEDGPEYFGKTRIPMSMCDKSFTDVLGPVNGFLRANTGRPWNKVKSELRQKLGGFSWPLQHVLTAHVDVEENTWINEHGAVVTDGAFGPRVVPDTYRRAGQFYVCPKSGLLKVAQLKRKSRRKPKPSKVEWVKAGDRWLVLIAGVWFLGEYDEKPFLPGDRWADPAWPDYYDRESGKTYIFRKIKSASNREIKKWTADVGRPFVR